MNKTIYPCSQGAKSLGIGNGKLKKNAIILHSGRFCEENDVIVVGAMGVEWSEKASLKR